MVVDAQKPNHCLIHGVFVVLTASKPTRSYSLRALGFVSTTSNRT